MPVPSLEDEPELPDDLQYIWKGFWELNTNRALGFGAVGYIPYSEITAYLQIFPVFDVEFFVACITAMDSVYVSRQLEKSKHDTTSPSNPSGR